MKYFGIPSSLGFFRRRCLRVSAWLALLPLAAALPLLAAEPVQYDLDLRQATSHQVLVNMSVPEAKAETEIQFPAWNALYQIRDFVRTVEDVQATCDAQPLALVRADLNTWSVGKRSCASLKVHYRVYCNEEGPFSAVLNEHHSFLNLAQVLFYLPQDRGRPVRARFELPSSWKFATLLGVTGRDEIAAANYDALVDSPIEAGNFQEYHYEQSGAEYHVVVDADPSDYSPNLLLDTLRKITATETSLMHEVPFKRYTFIYHFPRQGTPGGGMEHAFGTAITLQASDMRDNWIHVESTTAHEFFHLWNVKRIRPAALEPVDYIHGNDTRDLWFSEGVTSTYQELVLLRSGLISREEFYRRLGFQIGQLQDRPARLFQSAEIAGREAWLEKYFDYLRPERSISYYNKGELLGVFLDLAIRHATQNRYGLDDLMRRLNRDYAQRGRYFTATGLQQLIREMAPGWDGVGAFFRDDVAGTSELDYDTYLGYAGLRVSRTSAKEAALGFRSTASIDGTITVESVEPGSRAERAGLRRGDILVAVNGKPLTGLPENQLFPQALSEPVEFEVRRGSQALTIRYKTEKVRTTVYRLGEIPNPAPEQLRVREGWLTGTTSGSH